MQRLAGRVVLRRLSGAQRSVVPIVVLQRSESTTVPGPLPPLHTIARFTSTEVTQLYGQFHSFTEKDSCMVGKEQFAEFLAPLGIEPTPRNVCFVVFSVSPY